MKASGDTYTASLPTDKVGDMFYYISVKTDKETITKPTNSAEPIVLNIDDGKVKGDPGHQAGRPPLQLADRSARHQDRYPVQGKGRFQVGEQDRHLLC